MIDARLGDFQLGLNWFINIPEAKEKRNEIDSFLVPNGNERRPGAGRRRPAQ